MRKNIIQTILFILLTTNLFAQKDAPVVGYASKLVELLKKDYNAMDPDLKDQELVENRTEVIAIFKSFLKDQDRVNLDITGYSKDLKKLDGDFDTYTSLKKQLTAFSASPPVAGKAVELSSYTAELKNLSDSMNAKKNEYYEGKSALDLKEIAAVMDLYKKSQNYYIEAVIEKFRKKYEAIGAKKVDAFSSTGTTTSVQKGVFTVPGELTAQMVLTALGELLAKRIQEELSLYATQRLQKWLSNTGPGDPMAEFRVILPQTTKYFLNYGTAEAAINIGQLREHIEGDLNSLLKNAENLRNTPRMKRFLTNYPEMDFALEGIKIIPALSGVKSPVDYFTILENSSILQKWPSSSEQEKINVTSAINLISLLARSLVIADGGETRLAGMDFIANYSADLNFYLLYVGFLNQQNLKYYNITFKNGSSTTSLGDFLKTVSSTASTSVSTIESHRVIFQNLLNTAAKSTEKVYKISSEIRKINKSEKPLMPDTLHAFVDAIIDVVEDIQSSTKVLITQLNGATDQALVVGYESPISKYFQVARSANDIVRDMQRKKFATAVFKTLEFSLTLQSNQNSGLIANADNFLLELKLSPAISAWNKVFKIISTKQDLKALSKDDKEAFQTVYSELIRLDIYAKNEKAERTALDFINALKTLCDKALISADYSITPDIRGFMDKEAIINLFLSYYTNKRISESIDNVRKYLTECTAKSGTNPVRIFSDSDISAFIAALKTYHQSYYQSYFVSGEKTESRVLREKRDQFLKRAAILAIAYSDNLPALNNPELLKVIRFVIEISTAENEDGVELALNHLVNKTGSYDEKRRAKFNVSINSYPGILPAYELSWKEHSTAKAFSVGFTAPIGLSFSWGSLKGNTDGFFIPLIDIGALTRVRLDGSKDDRTLPELSFKNVFAPGLYYSHGFKNSPFAVNIGVQYGPDLKEITYNEAGTALSKSYESMRVGLGLVLDIPLYGLSNRPRK